MGGRLEGSRVRVSRGHLGFVGCTWRLALSGNGGNGHLGVRPPSKAHPGRGTVFGWSRPAGANGPTPPCLFLSPSGCCNFIRDVSELSPCAVPAGRGLGPPRPGPAQGPSPLPFPYLPSPTAAQLGLAKGTRVTPEENQCLLVWGGHPALFGSRRPPVEVGAKPGQQEPRPPLPTVQAPCPPGPLASWPLSVSSSGHWPRLSQRTVTMARKVCHGGCILSEAGRKNSPPARRERWGGGVSAKANVSLS